MQPSKSKSRTIMTFSSPSSPKKQRLNNQELHHSSTSTETSTKLVLSEETNLHRPNTSTNLHDSATDIHNKSISRNAMTHARLSDICLLAIERDIDIHFEQLIDTFSDIYKNSRIILK
ncbi:unnamed protein product [Rotaria socialis]|uniref:Uncharacterized protein n=1 Tax=Rotaria socialis TaxID=392032 RepID=A0A822A7Y2_9BILA|nr:unnamed protein product [Rotaria socialis]CAF3446493.1 unnamed protein product [Rotaria socialis]CAF4212230.1 unnamed protein product [Rotaria socialis]CAF4600984.1 unnamed protein product [Rotaria socialis]CAF4705169.1 unnamed protein product [Rotaria socialis]